LGRDAQTCHRVAIDANVEHGQARRLLDLHVRCALRLAQHRSDLLGRPVHWCEVVAEHLHRDVAAHAGDQLVEAHLDGLGDLIGIARELREITLDPTYQLLLGKLGFGQSLRGFRMTNMSVAFGGIGSAASSAVPVLE
jgi:hypothetical protein